MTQVGFYFDMTKCSGCRVCQVVCKDRNNLDVGIRYREVHTYTVGSFPNVSGYNYSGACNHCADPACLAACPAGAIHKLADGTVVIDQETCIGCGTCVRTCPYGAPKLDPAVGVSGKCDGCYTLRAKGEQPACVTSCLCRALDFGDLDELAAKYGDDFVRDVCVLPDSGQTDPSLLIRAKDAAFEESFKEMIL